MRTIAKNRGLFAPVLACFALLAFPFVGIAQQSKQTEGDVNPVQMQLDRAAPGHFQPDSQLEIQVTVTASTTEGLSAVGLRETPPQGWVYTGNRPISNEPPAVARQDEASGVVEFAWITPPVMPVTFAYTLQVPPPGPQSSGPKFVSGQVEYRTEGGRLVSPPVITSLQGEDVVPPELTLLGENPLFMDEGEPFVEPGYHATDDVDGDVTSKVQVSGNVDTSRPGTYQMTYSVRDNAGNETIKTRVVRVRAAPEVANNTPTGGTTARRDDNQSARDDRRRGGGGVGTAFNNFDNELDRDSQPAGQNNPQQGGTTQPRHPHDTGQPSSPENAAPRTVFRGPIETTVSNPHQPRPVQPTNPSATSQTASARNTTNAGGDARPSPQTKPEAQTRPVGDAAPAHIVMAHATEGDYPAILGNRGSTATPAIATPETLPAPGVFARIAHNLGQISRQELVGLAGLGAIFIVLSVVAFTFWRNAYRPPTRR